MSGVRIVTNIDANHGSVVFNAAAQQVLRAALPGADIGFLDAVPARFRAYERVRLAKVWRRIPLYNLRRYQTLMRYSREHLAIERRPKGRTYPATMASLAQLDLDALVVAKVVWNLNEGRFTPRFPNIFWPDVDVTRVAYAVSGHLTDVEVLRQHACEVRRLLEGFSLIGVRDDMTEWMLQEVGVDGGVGRVRRICDPAFLFRPRPIDTDELCVRLGIPRDRPIAGLLMYGKEEISQATAETLHRDGHLLINFNMYNPAADVNVGHLVDPDEWAALFRILDFCVTDRFHGSVFAIRESIPFVAVEPFQPETPRHSKILSLLAEFGIDDHCYVDQYTDGFTTAELTSQNRAVRDAWQGEIAAPLAERVDSKVADHLAFVGDLAELAQEGR